MKYFSLPIASRRPYRYGYPKLDPFIWRRLRSTDFKILHSHCPFSSGRLAVYVKKHQNVPLIGTFHSKYKSDLEHSFKRMPWCVPIIMKRILNFFNACDEVWIPQAQVEETVREYGYKGALQVVENGNDFASVISGDLWTYKNDAKKRLGMSEKNLNLLFVGQHIWEKGLRVIADTLHELDGKVDFRMNFIGTVLKLYSIGYLLISPKTNGDYTSLTVSRFTSVRFGTEWSTTAGARAGLTTAEARLTVFYFPARIFSLTFTV